MITLIHAVEKGAYVYHDGISIKGISFVVDEALDKQFDHFMISAELAGAFVHGEMDCHRWFIWKNGNSLALYNKQDILLDDADKQFERIGDDIIQLGMIIKIFEQANILTFQISTEITKLTTKLSHFVYVLTQKNDPSAVLDVISIPVDVLLNDRFVQVPLRYLNFDLYTRKVFPSYSLTYATADEVVAIPLPRGHFVDLMRVGRQPVEHGLQAVFNRSANTMTLTVDHGAEVYNRALSNLRLLFSLPGDPSLLLYATSVPTIDLPNGITIELPDIEDFDLWTPLLYCQTCLMES